jgi:hypothetical protein
MYDAKNTKAAYLERFEAGLFTGSQEFFQDQFFNLFVQTHLTDTLATLAELQFLIGETEVLFMNKDDRHRSIGSRIGMNT